MVRFYAISERALEKKFIWNMRNIDVIMILGLIKNLKPKMGDSFKGYLVFYKCGVFHETSRRN